MARKICMGMFSKGTVGRRVWEFIAQFDLMPSDFRPELDEWKLRLLSFRQHKLDVAPTLIPQWNEIGTRLRQLRYNTICYLHCTFRNNDELRVSPSVLDAAQAYEPLLSRSKVVRCNVSVFSPVILIPCKEWKEKSEVFFINKAEF